MCCQLLNPLEFFYRPYIFDLRGRVLQLLNLRILFIIHGIFTLFPVQLRNSPELHSLRAAKPALLEVDFKQRCDLFGMLVIVHQFFDIVPQVIQHLFRLDVLRFGVLFILHRYHPLSSSGSPRSFFIRLLCIYHTLQ